MKTKGPSRIFTPDQVKFIQDGFASLKFADLTSELNRTFGTEFKVSQIKGFVSNNGIRSTRGTFATKFTDEELEFLRVGYQTMGLKDLVERFNVQFGKSRSYGSISTALCNRGITDPDRSVAKPLLTPEQGKFILENCTNFTNDELTEELNRLYGTSYTTTQIHRFRHDRNIQAKRPVPMSSNPVGHERIERGFIMVRVESDHPRVSHDPDNKYVPKHLLVWEQAHGPVPKGHYVIFLDENKMNCDLDNLKMVTGSEYIRLQTNGFKGASAELKPSLLLLTKIDVKVREKSGSGNRGVCSTCKRPNVPRTSKSECYRCYYRKRRGADPLTGAKL